MTVDISRLRQAISSWLVSFRYKHVDSGIKREQANRVYAALMPISLVELYTADVLSMATLRSPQDIDGDSINDDGIS